MLKVKRLTASVLSVRCISLTHANDFKVLNQISKQHTQLQSGEYKGNYYVPYTLNTITWGYLPNRDAKP
ncbi:acetamidase, partial [Acinetobacter geminorum]